MKMGLHFSKNIRHVRTVSNLMIQFLGVYVEATYPFLWDVQPMAPIESILTNSRRALSRSGTEDALERSEAICITKNLQLIGRSRCKVSLIMFKSGIHKDSTRDSEEILQDL